MTLGNDAYAMETLEERRFLSGAALMAPVEAAVDQPAVHMRPARMSTDVDMHGTWKGTIVLSNTRYGTYNIPLTMVIARGTALTTVSGYGTFVFQRHTYGPYNFRGTSLGGSRGVFSVMGFNGNYHQTISDHDWTCTGSVVYMGLTFTFNVHLRR